MEWLAANWLWIAMAFAFFAMHFLGHGIHGSHRQHGRDGGNGALHPQPPTNDTNAQQADALGAVQRAANPINPALGGMPANSNHAAARSTPDEKQHRC